MANTFIRNELPVAFSANPGGTTTLLSLLTQSFGSQVASLPGVFISYDSMADQTNNNFSYWDPANPSVTTISKNGVDIGADNEIFVAAADFGKITLTAGNPIYGNVHLDYQIATNGSNYVYETYDIKTLPAAGLPTPNFDGVVNPADIVAAAEAYGAKYHGLANPNDCHFIAASIAAAAGATFAEAFAATQSLDPSQNQESGYWRIVARGSDGNLPSDWQTLVQPGDIVRFDYLSASQPQHTLTVVHGEVNHQIEVVDNTDTGGTIGEHWTNFDAESNTATVTIYRLTPDHLYLINASAFNDTVYGTVWNDDLRGLDGNDHLYGGVGADTIEGGNGADSLYGGADNDILYGQGDADTLNGGAGHDTLYGGSGDDLYQLYDVSPDSHGVVSFDEIVESAGGGTDTVEIMQPSSSGPHSYTLLPAVENGSIVGSGTLGFTLFGNDLSNVLRDEAGGNTLDGGNGNDTLSGYYASTLYGGAGQDVLYAYDSADHLYGGADNDQYYLNVRGSDGTYATVTETSDGGDSDRVYVNPIHDAQHGDSYTLTANVENGAVVGTANFDLVGNELANVLIGNDGNNVLTGGDGADTLTGNGGEDTLIGGEGSDFYFLNDVSNGNYDAVQETDAGPGGGIDHVYITPFDSVPTYTLGANVENGYIVDPLPGLEGSANFYLHGNSLDNRLFGNDQNNDFSGGLGNDQIDGAGGTDRANFSGDPHTIQRVDAPGVPTKWIVTDTAAGGGADGTDTLTNIELLNFGGSDIAVANLIGALTDTNAAANAVSEGGGATARPVGITAHADGNNVTYSLEDHSRPHQFQVDPNTGVVTTNPGVYIDYESTPVLHITVTATSADGSFTNQNFDIQILDVAEPKNGTPGRDNLVGGSGADLITGGGGRDVQTGGLGADHFIFTKVTDSRPGIRSHDVITVFSHAQRDLIDLSAIDANTHFRGNQAFKFIAAQAFHHRAGELRYDFHTGLVQGDVNGDGHADIEISLSNHAHLLRADFIL